MTIKYYRSMCCATVGCLGVDRHLLENQHRMNGADRSTVPHIFHYDADEKNDDGDEGSGDETPKQWFRGGKIPDLESCDPSDEYDVHDGVGVTFYFEIFLPILNIYK